MDSWRDTASAEAQADFDGMLTAVQSFAEQILPTNGELWPYGAAVTTDGQMIMVAADPDLPDDLDSDEVLNALYEGAIASAGDWRAAVFVSEVRLVNDGGPAMLFEFEHRDGAALDVLLPFTLAGAGQPITVGAKIEVIGGQLVWSPQRQAQWRASHEAPER